MKLHHQRPGLVPDSHVLGEQSQKLLLGGAIDEPTLIPHKLKGDAVHPRAKNFHQVVSQRKGIVPVLMLQPKRRMQPCGNESTAIAARIAM